MTTATMPVHRTASSAGSAPAPAAAWRPAAVLAVLVGAQLMIWIDNTILNVALKTLADPVAGLGASPEALEWSLNSYTLSFAACMLAGGAIGDRLGRRATFMAGLIVFAAASAWAAWSPSTDSLIAARAVMGLGSALVVPATLALIRSLFDGPARTRAVALWSASGGLAIAIGPLLGGALLEHFWWGSVFLVNVPVVLVALGAAAAVLPEARAVERAPLDVAGMLLSAAGLAACVYGIIEGGRLGDWTSTRVWGPAAAGVLLLAVFVRVEVRSRAPSFDMRLFANRSFTGASVGISLSFFGLVGSMFYSIFYLQGVRGLSPLTSGVVLLPVALGVLAGAPVGTRLARSLGVRACAAPALVVVAGTLLGYAVLRTDTPMWQFEVLLAVQGLAIGAAVAPLTDAVVTVLPPARAAAGAAVNSVLRQVGSVLGVAVLGSLLASTYRSEVAPLAGALPPPLRDAVTQSAEAARAAAEAAGMRGLLPAVDAAFLEGMGTAAVIAAVVAVSGAAVVGLAMPARALRGRHASRDPGNTGRRRAGAPVTPPRRTAPGKHRVTSPRDGSPRREPAHHGGVRLHATGEQ